MSQMRMTRRVIGMIGPVVSLETIPQERVPSPKKTPHTKRDPGELQPSRLAPVK